MSLTREQKYLLRQNPWYQAAVGSAIISCVFSAFLIAMLGGAIYNAKVEDPKRAEVLLDKKEQYENQSANEALKEEIRLLDQRIRRDQFARMQFIRRGVAGLVVFFAVLIGSMLWVQSFAKKMPVPEGPPVGAEQQVRYAKYARGAVTLSMIVLGGLAFYAIQWEQSAGQPDEAAGEETASVTDEMAMDVKTAAPEVVVFPEMDEVQKQWPVFRGPGGLGVCEFEDIPMEWDGASGLNVLWKVPVPPAGHNSPVVWGDRIVLTSATGDTRQVLCFDAATGERLWSGSVPISSDPGLADMYIMEDTGYAASTAVCNGLYAAAVFVDGQIGCFDIDGKRQWIKSLGLPESAYGYASSLTFYEDKVIVQLDQGYDTDKSKLIAMDFVTGDVAWQTSRPVPNSWTSPTAAKVGGRYQILTSGSPWMIGYDPATGGELWKAECLGGDVAPTQVVYDGKVFGIEPYSTLAAVDPSAAEDRRIAWKAEEDMPDICSPVAGGGLIWTLTTQGDLFCFDTADGSKVYEQSLESSYNASPALAGDRLYLLDIEGKMTIAKAGREFEIIQENNLSEGTFASPAFGPGRIYLRGTEHLYCIGTAP